MSQPEDSGRGWGSGGEAPGNSAVSGPYGGTPLPPPAPGWTPPPPAAPIDRVRGPAIAMMIAAALVALYVVGTGGLYAVMFFFGQTQQPAMGTRPDIAPLILGGTVAVVLAMVALAFAGFIGFGAFKMMRLQSYPIAMAAAICTFAIGLPCSCCPVNTVVAWPIAIWSIVVLSDPAVKGAFNAPSSIASTFD